MAIVGKFQSAIISQAGWEGNYRLSKLNHVNRQIKEIPLIILVEYYMGWSSMHASVFLLVAFVSETIRKRKKGFVLEGKANEHCYIILVDLGRNSHLQLFTIAPYIQVHLCVQTIIYK